MRAPKNPQIRAAKAARNLRISAHIPNTHGYPILEIYKQIS